MTRILVTLLGADLLFAGLLAPAAAGANENGFVDVPDAVIKTMDINRAMDLVTAYEGHDWLRSLRWTCPYVSQSGERGVDHYGVRLENFVGVQLDEVESWPAVGTIYFNYPPVPNNFCRIPVRVASQQDAVELTAAFRYLAREPVESRQRAIAARYSLDTGHVDSMERFLGTEASIDIARVLLQDAVQSLVQPGGAGAFIGEPPPLPAGSEYTMTASRQTDTVLRDSQYEESFHVLTAGNGVFEVQKARGDRTQDCTDGNFFRAITQDASQSCRSGTGATTTTAFLVQEGQAAYLPATINTATVYEAETEATVTLSDGRGFTQKKRQIRACYAEAVETISVPAGSFDTVRFRCGSVTSDPSNHDKQFGTVWVDRNSGLPVRSEMNVTSVYGADRYRFNQQVVSLDKP